MSMLAIAHKHSNRTPGIWGPASFAWHDVCKVYPCCSMEPCFIRFYCWVIFHCIDGHILFIHHLMVDEHLRCFHLLAVRNKGAGNICFQVLVWMHLFIPLGVYLGVGLLGLWRLHVYHLEKISYWFPIRCNICIYTFSTFSPTFIIVCLLYFSHPCACKVVTKIYCYVFIYEFCSCSSYT